MAEAKRIQRITKAIRGKTKRIRPQRNIIVTVAQSEFIDAQKDEFGITASEVVRQALEFFIQYKIKPVIIAKAIAEQEQFERARLIEMAAEQVEREKQEKEARAARARASRKVAA